MATFGDIMIREPYRPVEFPGKKCVWRLVMFKDAPRVDFHINLLEVLEEDVKASELPVSYDLGYEVLLDKEGITQRLRPPTYTAYRTKPPTEAEYDELVNVFWLDDQGS